MNTPPDPYRPPESNLANGTEVQVGRFRLDTKPYRIGGIGIASFLGGSFCGGILIFLNERMRQGGGRPWLGFFLSILYLLAVLLVTFGLEFLGIEGFLVNILANVAQMFIMMQVASEMQGPALDAHVAEHRAVASNWKAVGVAALVWLVILAAASPFIFLWSLNGGYF